MLKIIALVLVCIIGIHIIVFVIFILVFVCFLFAVCCKRSVLRRLQAQTLPDATPPEENSTYLP